MNLENQPTILLLDDEERIVSTLRMILRTTGKYRVISATDGDAALALLRQHRINVIISDQRMPKMTGVAFLAQAKQISPHSVRILLTGFSDMNAIIDSINEGEVFRFLNKPWGNRELLSVVADAVEVSLGLERAGAVGVATISRAAPVPGPVAGTIVGRGAAVLTSISYAGVVVVKTPSSAFFEQIKAGLPRTVTCLHALNLERAVALLEAHRVAVLAAHCDSDFSAEEDAILFKLLKQNYPALLTVAIMSGNDSKYMIQLINQARVYRYVTLPCKPARVTFSIELALSQFQKSLSSPELLMMQRAERAADFAEIPEITLSGKSRDLEGKTSWGGLVSRIRSLGQRWFGQ